MKEALRLYPWSRVYVLIAGPFVLLFVFVTPPSQAPDEPAHFDRAYEVSEGHLIPQRLGPWVGDELPASVDRIGKTFEAGLPFHPERKQSVRRILAGFSVSLDPQRRVFVSFPNTAVLGFVAYVPQGAAIAAARIVAAPPLALFYLARLAVAGSSVLLMALAIRTVPFGTPVFFLLALAPMTIFEMASLSADGVTNGIAFLLIAWLLRCAFGEEVRLSRRSVLFSLVLAVLLSLSKPGYFLLSALALSIPWKKFGTRRKQIGFLLLLFAGSIGAALLWARLVAPFHALAASSGVMAATEHMHAIREHPLAFLIRLAVYYFRLAPTFGHQFLGMLGWVDTPLPLSAAILEAVGLLVVALTMANATLIRWTDRILWVGIIGASLVVLGVILYLYSTPAEAGVYFLHGVQGRYFIPLAPLGLLALANARLRVSWNRYPAAVSVWASVLLAAALSTVVVRYYL